MGRWTLLTPERILDRHELTAEQRSVLRYLPAAGDLADLADLSGIEASDLASMLAGLEERGIVAENASELPEGVVPWEGDAMPVGSVSVAPEAEASSEVPEPPQNEHYAADWQRSYTRDFAPLSEDERIAAVEHARGPELGAWCFEPEPRVVAALLENSEFGPTHARLVARHHRNARGLELLARRRGLLLDPEVQRRLLQNPQSPAEVLMRLLGGKPLRDVYKLSVDHDLPERNRTLIRGELRKKFIQVEPEERAELVLRTEGRALLLLTGCPFDGRTTQILCSKSLVSTLLIGNLARFSATPPPLLAKLLQNPVVRRQPQLRTLLLKHPNLPSDAKRGS